MTKLSWAEIKSLRIPPPHLLTSDERSAALLEKDARRVDRVVRRAHRVALGKRRPQRPYSLDFPDGCYEEYDQHNRLTMMDRAAEHDPAAHAGLSEATS